MDQSLGAAVRQAIERDGYAFVPAATMRATLEASGPLSDWETFTASWDALGPDSYLAEQGSYRRRRYAVYAVGRGGGRREAHQPHYQSHDYNPLFGGIARWFEPVTPEVGNGASLQTILHFCHGLFGSLAPDIHEWRAEVHQFRIEARAGHEGRPTPEGLHRDGVDFAFVLLARRRNVVSGTTTIHSLDRAQLGSFTLTDPFDAALVDDNRVYHGVTPVTPLDPAAPAYRDALVVTFRAQ